MAQHDLIFYEHRSTPKVAKRGEHVEPKKGYGKQTSRRHATADEETVIASGRWLRVDEAGHRPSSAKYKASSYRTRQGAQRKKTNKKIAAES